MRTIQVFLQSSLSEVFSPYLKIYLTNSSSNFLNPTSSITTPRDHLKKDSIMKSFVTFSTLFLTFRIPFTRRTSISMHGAEPETSSYCDSNCR